MHQPLMHLFVWLRVPGDVVFSVGPVLLALFLAKLWLGGRGARVPRHETAAGATLPAE
jgi:nitric oxide reductase subunit B